MVSKIPLLWINCDHNTERAEHMLRQTNRYWETAVRIPAILGNQITAKPRYGLNAYACLLSHLWAQQQLLMNTCMEWVAVAEDDVVFLGGVDQSLLATAPEDATILQLTTLTGRHYDQQTVAVTDLWTRVTNGYYGTQLYLVRVPRLAKLFHDVGIIDVRNYMHQMLPDVDGGLEVADSYTYCLHTTYLCAYPFAYSATTLGSELHPEHLDMHEQGWDAVRRHHDRFPNPYLLKE